MKPLMLIVADYAQIEPQTGKIYILGAFNRIASVQYPTKHPAFSVIVKLGKELEDDHNEHLFMLTLTDEDGQESFRISASFDFPKMPAGIPAEFNAVLELRDVVFPHPGEYRLTVFVNNEAIESSPLILAHTKSQE